VPEIGVPAPPPPGMADVVLIGCLRTKREPALPAAELFDSPLFAARRRHAAASGRPWYILSGQPADTRSQREAPPMANMRADGQHAAAGAPAARVLTVRQPHAHLLIHGFPSAGVKAVQNRSTCDRAITSVTHIIRAIETSYAAPIRTPGVEPTAVPDGSIWRALQIPYAVWSALHRSFRRRHPSAYA
jgi:hypothetical protein